MATVTSNSINTDVVKYVNKILKYYKIVNNNIIIYENYRIIIT